MRSVVNTSLADLDVLFDENTSVKTENIDFEAIIAIKR